MSDLFPLGSAMKEKLSISSEERSQLEEFVRRRSSPQWLVQRSTILLKLTSGTGIRPLARSLEISRNTVRFWRDRWRSGTALRNGNGLPEAPPLSERLIRTLSDRPRPGGPPTFGPEIAVAIVALACGRPEEFGRAISHWTPRELADEAGKQKIVTGISHGSVANFLKGSPASTAPQHVLASSQSRG